MTNDPLNVKLQGKLKSLHFHYHSAYGHKIWQAADFPWAASTHDITPPFYHMFLQDHVRN